MTSGPKLPAETENRMNFFGHKATFLGHGKIGFPIAVNELRMMTQAYRLTREDQKIMDAILTSLEKENTLPFDWSPQEQMYLERHGMGEVIPYLVYRYKFFEFPKQRIVSDFPVHLLLEPSSACNLRCVMCFQTDKTFTKKPYMGMMEFDLYRTIVDQAAEGGARAISLTSRGEPMMNKRFVDMLHYASEKKTFIDLKINSNGTWLDEEMCHGILSSDANVLVISIDAHTEQMYKEIRVRGNFDRVVSNVRRLFEIRSRQYPGSGLEIRISGVKIRDDQNENDFRKFWSEMSDNVVYVHMQARWDTYNNNPHPEKNYPCAFLWNRLYIWHDGTCNPCDEDYKSQLRLGNIKEQSLRDIWHSPKMTEFRNRHMSGARKDIMPCDRCGV